MDPGERTRLLRLPPDEIIHELAQAQSSVERWKREADRNRQPRHWLLDLLRQHGPVVAMLGVFVAWESNLLPSNSRTAVQLIREHEANIERRVERRAQVDERLTKTLEMLAVQSQRQNTVMQAFCYEFVRVPEIRRRCLE